MVARALACWAPTVVALGGEMPKLADVMERLREVAPRIVPLLDETSKLVERAVRDGKRVLFEGAQDAPRHRSRDVPVRDVVARDGGRRVRGDGVGPSKIDFVVGLVKAYTTRVGGGPFPTELDDATGERLRTRGDEFGSVTGRPRRTGWLDPAGPPVRRPRERARRAGDHEARRHDGPRRSEGLHRVPHAGQTTEDFPIDEAEHAEPVYESMPGWSADLAKAAQMADLPETAHRYIERLEREAGCPVVLVSVGAAATRRLRSTTRSPSARRTVLGRNR